MRRPLRVAGPSGPAAAFVTCVLACSTGATAAGPWSYDFVKATGAGLALDTAGSAALRKVAVAGRDGMAATAAHDKPARLVLRLADAEWPTQAFALAVTLEYYDRATPAGLKRGGDRLMLVCAPPGGRRATRRSGIASLYIACRDKPCEPYRGARWRRHSVLLRDCRGGSKRRPSVVEVQISGQCILRSVGVEPVGPDIVRAWDGHVSACDRFFLRQTKVVIARVRAEDVVRQLQRAHAYARQAGRDGWPAAIHALRTRQAALLATLRQAEDGVDGHYYEGRAAVVANRPADLQKQQTALAATLSRAETQCAELDRLARAALAKATAERAAIDKAFRPVARIEVQPRPDAPAVPDYFKQRIRFFTFSNSGVTLQRNRALWHQVQALYGIESMFRVTGLSSTAEGGSADAWQRSTETLRRIASTNAANGMTCAIVALHIHNMYITGGLPGWFRKKYAGTEYLDRSYDGEQNTTGQNSGTVNVWHPGIQRYVTDYATVVGREAARAPNVVAFVCFGEAHFRLRYRVSIGYTELAAKAFRRRLQKGYGTVARLNAAWGATYASFDAVAPPPPREKQGWRITALAFEWEQFMRQAYEDHARRVYDAFKAVCPNKPVWFEAAESLYSADINHTHVRPIPDVNIANYNHPRVYGKTTADAETGGGHYPEGERENPAEIDRAATERNLLGALYWGQRGLTFWFRFFTSNANGYYAAFHDNPSGALVMGTRDCSSLAVVRDKADRFNHLLRDTTVVPSGVGYVHAGIVSRLGGLGVDGRRIVVTHFYRHGYPTFMASADHILDGREDLTQYRALFVASSPVVREGLNQKLAAWVKAGGLMIAVGPWGLMTPSGKPAGQLVGEAFGQVKATFVLDRAALAKATPRPVPKRYRHLLCDARWTSIANREWYVPLTIANRKPTVRVLMADRHDHPLILEAPLGKGTVIMSAVPLYSTWKYLLKRIAQRVPSLARRADGGPLHSLVREDARGVRYLCVINPDSAKPIDSRVVLDGRYARVTDLGIDGGFPVPVSLEGQTTTIPIRLAPGEGTVLGLTRR